MSIVLLKISKFGSPGLFCLDIFYTKKKKIAANFVCFITKTRNLQVVKGYMTFLKINNEYTRPYHLSTQASLHCNRKMQSSEPAHPQFGVLQRYKVTVHHYKRRA